MVTWFPSVTGEYVQDWALVDVETSGSRASRDRVLSLAVITVDRDGRQTGEFSTLLDPGCDPGPVEVHGLTAERLRGAPTFDRVAPRVAELLSGRVMVAHNAQFDYDFLAREFTGAGVEPPIDSRLCTLALNRRIAPPTPDLRLGTLVGHYGVPRLELHDALNDTRMLAGVLRGSLEAASRLGLSLPFVPCPPRRNLSYAPGIPKIRCPYRNPGPLVGPLVQGMKVAFSGETSLPRTELTVRAAGAGLNVMGSVSRHTSVLVVNDPRSETGKVLRAMAAGVPVIGEAAFLRLLEHVQPGEPIESGLRVPPQARRVPVPEGPLTGRRVLVLGGPHAEAVKARARVAGLGGAVSVNLSRTVTDVLLLDGGENDRRLGKIKDLGLPVREPSWLRDPQAVPSGPSARVLIRGAAVDLPDAPVWTIGVSWAQRTTCEIDVVAFALDGDEQVSGDGDFVFYGAPETPDGSIRLSTDGPVEQSVTVDLAALPVQIDKVVVAAAIDGPDTFGTVGAVETTVFPGTSAPHAEATLDAATTERTLLLAELYRRNGLWRLRAVGQGYDHDLAALARHYGVDIAD
ncbi:TerD family protein [Actinocorallia aurantiaca]|uniref:BRCT domain-containing protein n=1 Tax=Actinocorallia aurantiaca TaxID=46204 RepID=A0ABN3UAQ3_9ACTN